ncbi:putative wall-associated receptor kinase, galacturonan-binding domain-containing protein [Helianthus annuus]|nr:putative wall-associated receptor kinase, galacturonan-binding domain-containing protein [Helianthus annuus]KAJ0656055.1 putative wall-associated receptor kinase, galacturonan-binding domain-containing protein [Helianthus annuus]
MKFFQAYLHILLFLLLAATPPTIANYAKQGCNDTCGNVRIPFPFGIGAECSVNKWFIIDCSSSKPYLRELNNLEVLRVDLDNPTVTVNTPRISDCQSLVLNSSDIMGVDLGGSPFLVSRLSNKFVFEGCGTAAMVANNGSVITGCSSDCDNGTPSNRTNCFGMGCCQTPIPHRVRSYNINLTRLEEEDGGCGFASLVDQTSYDQGNVSVRDSPFIPISLVWTLPNPDQITCCDSNHPETRKVALYNGTAVDTWMCGGQLLGGNPYLKDGCNTYERMEECRQCRDLGGNCKNSTILDVDGTVYSWNITCYDIKWKPSKTNPRGVILGNVI